MRIYTYRTNKKISEELKDADIDKLEDIELEKRCENYLNIKNIHKRIKKIKSLGIFKDRLKENVRKDLYDSLRKLEKESLVRHWASYFLRGVKADIKNGFQNLSYREQEKTISLALQEITSVLGVEDMYFSKRIGSYNQTNYPIPLRKDITAHIYRAYLRNSKLD